MSFIEKTLACYHCVDVPLFGTEDVIDSSSLARSADIGLPSTDKEL
jgi:hypothetical protein